LLQRILFLFTIISPAFNLFQQIIRESAIIFSILIYINNLFIYRYFYLSFHAA